MLSLFLRWSFQICFSVAIYFWHPFSKFFFDGSLLWPQFFWHFNLAFLYLFWGKRVCVCVFVCVVDPVFSWCCPAQTASWCYPLGVLSFWHSRIVIAFIISLPKKTGLIFLTFYDIVYWPMVWQFVTWFWLSWPVVPLAGSGWCGPVSSGGIWSSCSEFPSSCILMINPEHSRKLVRDDKIINSQFVLLYSFTFSHVLTLIYQ